MKIHPVSSAHYLVFSRYPERMLPATNELILSALPAHERKYTFASAEGASGENWSDLDREFTKNTQLFALIISIFQGILNACSCERAHFERAFAYERKYVLASAEGASGKT